MVLHIDSDTTYLILPNTKSRIAGYYFLSDHPKKISPPILNRAILVECKALFYIISSLAKAKTVGIFNNAQIAIPIRCLLESLRYL